MKYATLETRTFDKMVTHHESFDSKEDALGHIETLALDLLSRWPSGRFFGNKSAGVFGVSYGPEYTEATMFHVWEDDGGRVE